MSFLVSGALMGPRGYRFSDVDSQINNCSGYVPAGNCGGAGPADPKWQPPNGNWWTISPNTPGYANPSAFDFAGGMTVVNSAMSPFNDPIFGSYGSYTVVGNLQTRTRTKQWANCGATNCYSNCNCNCNCECDCNCW